MPGAVIAGLLELLSARDAPAFAPSLDAAGWDALAREAVRHGVAPLVHARLASAGAQWPVPEPVRNALKACHLRTGLENLRLLARLAAVLRGLQAEGVQVIVLKGAYLAQAVYGEPALRSMGDADILVRPADLERATRVLHSAGWREGAATALTSVGGGGHQLPTFVLGGAQVELHWAIEDDTSPFVIDDDGLWQRAVRCEVGGAPALALSAEDLLLHLCLHAAYGHGWLQFESGLRPLCDIAACLRRFEGRIDWPVLVARARAWRVHTSAWLTLTLLRDLLRAGVPQHVLDGLVPRPVDRALVDTATRLVLGHHYRELVDHLPVLGRSWLTKYWHRLPPPARWRAHALPGPDALATAYPSFRSGALRPLRYAAHWADLLNDVARLSFGRRGRVLVAQERSRMQVLRWLESAR